MKKYLLGLFAVVFAIGFSAFTNISRVDDGYLFEYQGTAFDQTSVSDESLWVYVEDYNPASSTLCPGTDQACRIVVTSKTMNNELDFSIDEFVNLDGTVRAEGPIDIATHKDPL